MQAWMKAGVAVAFAAVGCGSSENRTGAGPTDEETTGITWHQDVAPIVSEHCLGCHQEGGIAPFSMETYENAAPYAAVMAQETAAERMPPWLAKDTEECVPRFGWQDDIRLSEAEKTTIAAWAEAGAPEGDASRAATLPEGAPLVIEDPDLSLVIPTSVEISGHSDAFWCFVLETNLETTQYYDQIQINAGNPAIVHHVLVYKDTNLRLDAERLAAQKYECFGGPGVSGAQLVTAWAPGGVPAATPPDVAYEFEPGTRLIMQVHYHPMGTAEMDELTSVDFRLAESMPAYRASTSLIGNFVAPSVVAGGLLPGTNDPEGELEFKIPAGAKDHVETMTSAVANPMIIYGAGTHMHYVGRDMVVHLQHAAPEGDEPERECLIQTPDWDFNWQRGYRYDAPLDEVPVARAGDQLIFQCRYDNSLENPFVREALEEQGLSEPRDVYLGEATLDEMCLGAFAVATPIE